ncbi:hypothetical protein Tco_0686977 [Tanacetum coccineum]
MKLYRYIREVISFQVPTTDAAPAYEYHYATARIAAEEQNLGGSGLSAMMTPDDPITQEEQYIGGSGLSAMMTLDDQVPTDAAPPHPPPDA